MYSKTKIENKDVAFLCIYKLSEYILYSYSFKKYCLNLIEFSKRKITYTLNNLIEQF